jgi:hypothetical protein
VSAPDLAAPLVAFRSWRLSVGPLEAPPAAPAEPTPAEPAPAAPEPDAPEPAPA